MIDSGDSPELLTGNELPRVFSKDEGVVLREIAGETFLVPVKGHLAQLQQIFVLSPVGFFIWDQIDGQQTIEEIAKKIAQRFTVDSQTATEDLVNYIQELEKAGLVAPETHENL